MRDEKRARGNRRCRHARDACPRPSKILRKGRAKGKRKRTSFGEMKGRVAPIAEVIAEAKRKERMMYEPVLGFLTR